MVSVFFYLIAAVMVGAAIVVVTSRNVVRAALALIVVFAGVAAQFILLAAEFVAITQVLVYIGAIMVLMLFGIMLTRARIGRDVDATNDHWWSGVITALLLVGVMAYALVDYYGGDKLPADRQINSVADSVGGSNTATVSDSIFSQYLIPFEVVSVLLLAALVGAIVIARKNTVLVLMSIELILNAVNINLLTFGALRGDVAGSVFALFIIAVAAAEVGVGLAMVLIIYRNRSSVDLDDVDSMRG